MFESVTLKRSGELEYTNQQETFIVDDDIVLPCLNFVAQMEDGVTLRTLFKMFSYYPTLTGLDTWIPHYMEDIRSLPELGCRKNFDSIIIQRCVEIVDKSTTPNPVFDPPSKSGTTRMRIETLDKPFSSFHHTFRASGAKKEEKEVYSLSMTPLREILDVPLVMGRSDVYIFGDEDYRHLVFEEPMTLNDMIMAIISEITFFGTDEQKEQEFHDIKDALEDHERGIKRERFTVIDGGKSD